jgi:hypothetical protein
MAIDSTGNIYSAKFGFAIGENTVAKFDSNGNLLWNAGDVP